MYFGILHAVFDLAMGAVLLHWAGRKLAQLSRHDTVAVVWECLISELRRLRSPQVETRKATAEFTTAADAMYR